MQPAGRRGGTSSAPGSCPEVRQDYLWSRYPPGCVTLMGGTGQTMALEVKGGLGISPCRASWRVWHWYHSNLESVLKNPNKQTKLQCFLSIYFSFIILCKQTNLPFLWCKSKPGWRPLSRCCQPHRIFFSGIECCLRGLHKI